MVEKLINQKAKLLEPTFHFKTLQVKIGEAYGTGDTPVSELVKADQLLADFPDFEKYSSMGFEKMNMVAGENTHFSDDDKSIFSSVAGYPKTVYSRKNGSSKPSIILSVEPLFIFTPDKMKATLSIHPALPDCCSLKNTNLQDHISSAGIVYGIDNETLIISEEYINQKEPEFNKIVIAQGKSAGTGHDAYFRFDMEIGPLAGRLMRDGTIDFRERKIMVGVTEGQCIATKIPAVTGEPGINVLGEETPAVFGKDITVKILGDAAFSEKTLQVTATSDGVLSIVNSSIIKVSSQQVISGDIDFNTGNIDSRNCVIIHGSVQPGFLVTVDGDLEITGSVMSTRIKSLGNVVIKGGITGKKSIVETQGDCDINFIEQGTIQSGGICVIRNQSYYSDIFSGSHVRCKDSSKIMSGRLIAEGNISVADVGSNDCKPSLIAAGVVPERFYLLKKLKKEVVEEQNAIVKWVKKYPGSSSSKKIRKMERALADKKLIILKLNMIPGTGIYSRVGPSKRDAPDPGPDYSNEGSIDIGSITIDVRGTIYAGTEIRIGNRLLKLNKTVYSRQFILHSDQKSIIAKPLKLTQTHETH